MKQFALVSVLFLIGCSNLGASIAGGYTLIEHTAISIQQECGNLQPDGPCTVMSRISTEEKSRHKASLQLGKTMLDAAREDYADDQTGSAKDSLAVVDRILAEIQRSLRARGIEE